MSRCVIHSIPYITDFITLKVLWSPQMMTDDQSYVRFVVVTSSLIFTTYHQIWLITGDTVTQQMPLVEPELLTFAKRRVYQSISEIRAAWSLVFLCSVSWTNLCLFCPFSFTICIVCPYSIYGIWLSLWYLQTFLVTLYMVFVLYMWSSIGISFTGSSLPKWFKLIISVTQDQNRLVNSYYTVYVCLFVCLFVFNATLNNISVIS